MKKLTLFLLLFTISVFPQFNKTHYDLVYTTFTREFNENIIDKYLNSENDEDVVAALLSVSHSTDTTLIEKIKKLDYEKFGEYISFALGQMPYSIESENYLISKLKEKKHLDNLLISLGKQGGEKSFSFLKKNYKQFISNEGFFVGLVNYHYNNKRLTKEEKEKILLPELKSKNPILESVLFALARCGVAEFDLSTASSLIKSVKDPEVIVSLISIIRRSTATPENLNIFSNQAETDWRIKNEIVRYLSKYKFENIKELQKYFSYLEDENGNVSREAATNLRNISIDTKLEKPFSELFNEYLHKDLEANTLDALFISLCNKYKEQSANYIRKYQNTVSKSALLNAATLIKNDSSEKFKLIKSLNENLSDSEMIAYASALFTIENISENKNYKNEILNLFNTKYPTAIFIASSGIDSSFAQNNKSDLLKLSNNILKVKKDDPQFAEIFEGIITLLDKISVKEKNKFAEELLKSKNLSTRNIAHRVLEQKPETRSDKKLFDKIWNYCFKYKTAKVNTTKGSFIINFRADIAPISVGNFLMLADSEYYNNCVYHRVVSNFVIQTGDPSGTGWGGPDHTIMSEFSTLNYLRGAVGMASSGKDTEGSQWYVMHSNFPHLNRRYTNFGFVNKEDLEVVDKILVGDKVLNIELK